MRYLLLLAMLLLPLEAGAWGPMAVVMGKAPSCTLPVTGETGDTGNYLSNWTLAGGPCGTIYYTADWADFVQSWAVRIYSDINHTRPLGGGDGTGTITISGNVTGSVAAISATGQETLYLEGTLTR